jgi:hypothetical protein
MLIARWTFCSGFVHIMSHDLRPRVEQVVRIHKGSANPPPLGKKWTLKSGSPSQLAMQCQLVHLEPAVCPKSYTREKL